jgi:hypothetical protein
MVSILQFKTKYFAIILLTQHATQSAKLIKPHLKEKFQADNWKM